SKIVEAERKTQTVRLNFIRISLNLSVFFIYWLVFAQSHFRRVWQSERDDVSKLIQMTKYQHNKTGDDTELIETTYHHPFVSCREKEILFD
ncbi:hypothetical protein, partial [Streptococcus suis]|uniref:hypothetical protein n=1 Tax=Streptococcus suis TaxID=1307 RepID=UPI001EE0D84E